MQSRPSRARSRSSWTRHDPTEPLYLSVDLGFPGRSIAPASKKRLCSSNRKTIGAPHWVMWCGTPSATTRACRDIARCGQISTVHACHRTPLLAVVLLVGASRIRDLEEGFSGQCHSPFLTISTTSNPSRLNTPATRSASERGKRGPTLSLPSEW